MKIYLDIPKEDISRALKLGARQDSVSSQYYILEDVNPKPFSAWILPAATRLDQANYLSLTELLSQVEETVSRGMPNSVWVRLEISDIKRINGHLYLHVVDRDNSGTELSKSEAKIWSTEIQRIEEKFHKETGTKLCRGMKLLVCVKVKFHTKYGFSVFITDIDPKFTLGDMEAKLRRIRESLNKLGEFCKNRDLSPPWDIANVAVISPDNAAGLGDFKIEADKLNVAGICRFRYYTAIFQGPETKDSMLKAFKSVHDYHKTEGYDVLVLIRGGGQIDDLHWLNELKIARLVCHTHIPVFTGIGHEKDSTILDECANRSFGTPSKVIGHIRELIFTRAVKASEDWNDLQWKAARSVELSTSGADHGMKNLTASACRILEEAGNRIFSSMMGINGRVEKLETFAEGRINSCNASIFENARSTASIAETSFRNLMARVNERSNGAIGSSQIKSYNDFASIKLAARRSIDGIDKHINNFSMEVPANAAMRVKSISEDSLRLFEEVKKSVHRYSSEASRFVDENFRTVFLDTRRVAYSATSGFDGFVGEISRAVLRISYLADEGSDLSMRESIALIVSLLDEGAAELDRYLNDLEYFALRSVENAEQSFKDLMSGIIAMGVEPTLNRGFTIVYSEGKPVTSRNEAEKKHAMEICFKDGKLNVTKSNQ